MATEVTGATQALQNNQQQLPNAAAAPAATSGTLGGTADTAVTRAAKPDQGAVGREDHGRQAKEKVLQHVRQSAGALRRSDVANSGLQTVVGFDVNEANRVYIRVQDSRTGVELAQIPSKEFVEYLRRRFEELSGEFANTAGVSQSI